MVVGSGFITVILFSRVGEGQKERESENLKPIPHPAGSLHQDRSWDPGIVTWADTKNQTLNWPSQIGTVTIVIFKLMYVLVGFSLFIFNFVKLFLTLLLILMDRYNPGNKSFWEP